MENVTMETIEKPQTQQPEIEKPESQQPESQQPESQQPESQQPQINLANIPVTDENTALNLMVSFLQIAHKRGAFNLEESSKIWECVKMFIHKQP
jgi:hypothetical protein